MKRIIHLTLVIGLALASNSQADQKSEAERIDGVAKFLVSRANANLLAIEQTKILDNGLMKCFLPKTTQEVENFGLDKMLSAPAEIWNASIKSDLDNLISAAYISSILKVAFKSPTADLSICELLSESSDNVKILNELLDDDGNLKNSSIYSKNLELINLLSGVYKKSKEYKGGYCKKEDTLCNENDIIKGELISRLDGLDKLIKSDVKIISYFNNVKEVYKSYKKEESYSNKVMAVYSLILDCTKLNFNNSKLCNADLENLGKFRNLALIIAKLTNGKENNSEDIAKMLEYYAVPPVSFANTRKGSSHVMISSYIGLNMNIDDRISNINGDDVNFGLFAPIGIEYSNAHCWLPLVANCGIMVSPFDFSMPINHVLHGTDSNATLRDVIAPAIYLTGALKNYPIVIGIGAQKGISFNDESKKNKIKYQFFFALDLPLFRLY